jgi:hypothetical protein
MRLSYLILLVLTVLVVVVRCMPQKKKDMAEAPEKAEQEITASGAGAPPAIHEPEEGILSLVRPIHRELGRYSGNRPADAGSALPGPFRGNVGESIRQSLRAELTADQIRLYGDGMLVPYFRQTVNELGMSKTEPVTGRPYMMEGNIEDVTRAMVAAGFTGFVLNDAGVREMVGHLVRQLLERQDRLVETGSRFSPQKLPGNYEQAIRLPAILDYHRWRVSVLPSLGPFGHVRITGE